MAQGHLSVPAWFQDHMILQQRVRIRVYGKSLPSAAVTLSLERFPAKGKLSAGDTEYGIIYQETDPAEEDGFFEFRLPFIEASFDPFKLTLESAGERLVFQDILFGEVWMAAGEAEMGMPVGLSDAAPLLEQMPGTPGLRFFTQEASGLDKGQQDYAYHPQRQIPKGRWIPTQAREQVAELSSIGVSFAYALRRALKCPVALFSLPCRDSLIHSWLPRQVIEKDVILKNHIKEIHHYRDEDNWNQLPQQPGLEERVRKREIVGGRAGKKRPFLKQNQPAALFNHKLAPYAGLALRGMLWYQGRSDRQYPDYYARAFQALAEVWRALFQSPVSGMQVIYSQILPGAEPGHEGLEVARFNEALAAVRRHLPIKAGMVTLYDLPLDYRKDQGPWSGPDHPICKRVIGERMQELAMGLSYHQDLPSSAPECCDAEQVGNKLILSFENAGQGIKLRPNEKILKGFTICGEDRQHIQASAKELYGVRAIAWHEEIVLPVSCSYAFYDFNQEANLCGSSGMPVVPFRLEREAQSLEKPRPWAACDKLKHWAYPKTDEHYRGRIQRSPGWYPLWQVRKGRGSFALEHENKRQGVAALSLRYKKADEHPLVFGPILDYASLFPPLDLSRWGQLELHVFHADHRKKRISLSLADANGRESISEPQEILDILSWQRLRFDLRQAQVDLMRLVRLEFILQDPDERGGLLLDELCCTALIKGSEASL